MSKSNSRQVLIEAGMERMLSAGYGGTGLSEILQIADVPKGSFYHHFASKEAFAEEVVRQFAANQEQKWKTILDDPKITPLKRLKKYFRLMIKDHGRAASVSGCLLGFLSLEVAEQSEPMRKLLKEAFDDWQLAIAATLAEAIEKQEISNKMKPDDVAAVLISLWEGAHVRAKAERSDKPLDLFYKYAFENLLAA